jgi:hypothetical protein
MNEGEGAKAAGDRHGSELRLLVTFCVYLWIDLLLCIDPKHEELL